MKKILFFLFLIPFLACAQRMTVLTDTNGTLLTPNVTNFLRANSILSSNDVIAAITLNSISNLIEGASTADAVNFSTNRSGITETNIQGALDKLYYPWDASNVNIIVDGDSKSVGLYNNLTTNFWWTNADHYLAGVGGVTLAYNTNAWLTDTVNHISTSKTNIYIFWGTHNDLKLADTETELLTLSNHLERVVSSNCLVIAVTASPSGYVDYYGNVQYIKIRTWNNFLRNSPLVWRVVDSEAMLPNPYESLFYADLIHNTAVGYNLIANEITRQLCAREKTVMPAVWTGIQGTNIVLAAPISNGVPGLIAYGSSANFKFASSNVYIPELALGGGTNGYTLYFDSTGSNLIAGPALSPSNGVSEAYIMAATNSVETSSTNFAKIYTDSKFTEGTNVSKIYTDTNIATLGLSTSNIEYEVVVNGTNYSSLFYQNATGTWTNGALLLTLHVTNNTTCFGQNTALTTGINTNKPYHFIADVYSALTNSLLGIQVGPGDSLSNFFLVRSNWTHIEASLLTHNPRWYFLISSNTSNYPLTFTNGESLLFSNIVFWEGDILTNRTAWTVETDTKIAALQSATNSLETQLTNGTNIVYGSITNLILPLLSADYTYLSNYSVTLHADAASRVVATNTALQSQITASTNLNFQSATNAAKVYTDSVLASSTNSGVTAAYVETATNELYTSVYTASQDYANDAIDTATNVNYGSITNLILPLLSADYTSLSNYSVTLWNDAASRVVATNTLLQTQITAATNANYQSATNAAKVYTDTQIAGISGGSVSTNISELTNHISVTSSNVTLYTGTNLNSTVTVYTNGRIILGTNALVIGANGYVGIGFGNAEAADQTYYKLYIHANPYIDGSLTLSGNLSTGFDLTAARNVIANSTNLVNYIYVTNGVKFRALTNGYLYSDASGNVSATTVTNSGSYPAGGLALTTETWTQNTNDGGYRWTNTYSYRVFIHTAYDSTASPTESTWEGVAVNDYTYWTNEQTQSIFVPLVPGDYISMWLSNSAWAPPKLRSKRD